MIDRVFNLCVDILVSLASLFGTTYEAINIWIFCVIWPLFTVFLILSIFRQRYIIRQLRGQQTVGEQKS
jgi:hypothetical protein